MNVKAAKAIYLSLIVIFLAIIIGCTYYFLGGFQEVRVYKVPSVQRTVFGKFFESPENDAYYDHGVYCRQLIEEGSINGVLTEVLYLNDTVDNMEAGRFLGVSVEEEMAEIPSDFEVREFDPRERYAVYLSMHPLVMPRPGTIESMIREKADSAGNQLVNFTFTLIYPDNSRSVEWWVEE